MLIGIPLLPAGRQGRSRTMLRTMQKVTFSRYMKANAALRLCVELTGSRRLGKRMYLAILDKGKGAETE